MARIGTLRINPLEDLNDLGVLTPEVERELYESLIFSSSGRAFGHSEAVELPRRLSELADVVSDWANEDEYIVQLRKRIDGVFREKKPKRLSSLNSLLLEIANEVEGVPNNSNNAYNNNSVTEIFFADPISIWNLYPIAPLLRVVKRWLKLAN